MTIYGALISDTAVENAVLAQLQSWLPSYLVEAAQQDGLSEIALPKSWETTRSGTNRWTEQGMPAVIVQIGGTIAVTRKGPKYRAVYGATVGCVVAGQSRPNTRKLAGIYAIAVAACMTQQAGDWSDGIDWTDTDYDLIDDDQSRTLMAAIVSFDVAVLGVLDVSAGPVGDPPDAPDTTPGTPDYGNVDEVIVEPEIIPIGEPFS